MRGLLFVLCASLLAAPFVHAHEPAGAPKLHCEDPSEFAVHDYLPAGGSDVMSTGDGGHPGCDDDLTTPPTGDGHSEHAVGGAALLAESGTGHEWGSGSLTCWDRPADHLPSNPITVQDRELGDVPFRVSVDAWMPVDPSRDGPRCGDFEHDGTLECLGTCTPTFGPGLDGAYYVYVPVGVGGHVIS